MESVSISSGNKKMGEIPSVSLPAIETCRQCDCFKKCYAKKIARLRPNVAAAYQRNLRILKDDPAKFWNEVSEKIRVSRYFRFHVSGDIPDEDYFCHMVSLAEENPQCQILCFTKKFEVVNSYLRKHNARLPDNMHILFSGWPGLKMDNPFNLPEAHVRFRNGFTTASASAVECGGNCTCCAVTDAGCWTLGKGEQVVFNEH